MKVWYSCKVKFGRETEDGFLKQVTEDYLVDAISYTEAESRIYGLMEQHISGEFTVHNISKTNIAEVINYEDAESWYKCKITYSTVDADNGKELKVTTYFLVSAEHVKMAFERVEDNLSSMLVPFEIPSITQTKIIDVFPLEIDGEENKAVSPEFEADNYNASIPTSQSFEAEGDPPAETDNSDFEATLPAQGPEDEEEEL